jgi:hypothetical protein
VPIGHEIENALFRFQHTFFLRRAHLEYGKRLIVLYAEFTSD